MNKWRYESKFEDMKVGFELARWHGFMDWINVYLKGKNLSYETNYFPLPHVKNEDELKERVEKILAEKFDEAPPKIRKCIRNNENKIRDALIKALRKYKKSDLYNDRDFESDIVIR